MLPECAIADVNEVGRRQNQLVGEQPFLPAALLLPVATLTVLLMRLSFIDFTATSSSFVPSACCRAHGWFAITASRLQSTRRYWPLKACRKGWNFVGLPLLSQQRTPSFANPCHICFSVASSGRPARWRQCHRN